MDKTKLLNLLGIKPLRDKNMPRKTALILATGIVITQALDFLSTYLGITYGSAQEGNPLISSLMSDYGWWGFVIFKLAAIPGILWLTWRRKTGSLVFIAIYIAVVCWNLSLTLKAL